MRTGALQRRIEGISAKMLTQTLKSLDEHGLILRHDHHEVPPHVDYRLTPLGESLCEAVGVLDKWVIENFWNTVDAAEARAASKGHDVSR